MNNVRDTGKSWMGHEGGVLDMIRYIGRGFGGSRPQTGGNGRLQSFCNIIFLSFLLHFLLCLSLGENPTVHLGVSLPLLQYTTRPGWKGTALAS
jgi:hypothetical protein